MEMVLSDSSKLKFPGVGCWVIEPGTQGTHLILAQTTPVAVNESKFPKGVEANSSMNKVPSADRCTMDQERREGNDSFTGNALEGITKHDSVNVGLDSNSEGTYKMKMVPIEDLPSVLSDSNSEGTYEMKVVPIEDLPSVLSALTGAGDTSSTLPYISSVVSLSNGNNNEGSLQDDEAIHRKLVGNEEMAGYSTTHVSPHKQSSGNTTESGVKVNCSDDMSGVDDYEFLLCKEEAESDDDLVTDRATKAIEEITEVKGASVASEEPQSLKQRLPFDGQSYALYAVDSVSSPSINGSTLKLVNVNKNSLKYNGRNQTAEIMTTGAEKKSTKGNKNRKKQEKSLLLDVEMPPKGIHGCISTPECDAKSYGKVKGKKRAPKVESKGMVGEGMKPCTKKESNEQNRILDNEISLQDVGEDTSPRSRKNSKESSKATSCTNSSKGKMVMKGMDGGQESTSENSRGLFDAEAENSRGLFDAEAQEMLRMWRQISSKCVADGVHTPENSGKEATDCDEVTKISTCGKDSEGGQKSPRQSLSLVKTEIDRLDRKKPFECDECGKGYANMSRLRQHKSIHAGQGQFRCAYCNKQFMKKATLEEHVRMHTGEKPHKCSLCDATFSWKSNCRRHELQHTNVKRNKCVICGKEYTQSWHLKMHMRLHSGERPFQCPKCPRKFHTRAYLRHHSRVHESGEGGTCEICGRHFRRKLTAEYHMMAHRGEQPYQCKVCNKKYGSASVLAVHMYTHTGEKPYACQTCGKHFSNAGNLCKHKRIHTGIKPYVCHICGKSFVHKTQIQYHWKVRLGKKDHLVMPDLFIPTDVVPAPTNPVTSPA